MKKYIFLGVLFFLWANIQLLAKPIVDLAPEIKNYVPEYRIVLKADVLDEDGVEIVRVYFKSFDSKDYAFVTMDCNGSKCEATLPAPSKTTEAINYIVLVKNSKNIVYKTDKYTAIAIKGVLPKYQLSAKDGVISVKTELLKVPESIEGFTDSIAIDTVDSSGKLGVVSGIHTTVQAGAISAGAGTSGGAVTAGGVGMSATVLVGGSALAIVAGIASSNNPNGEPTVYDPSSSNSEAYSVALTTLDLDKSTWSEQRRIVSYKGGCQGTVLTNNYTYSYNGSSYVKTYNSRQTIKDDCSVVAQAGSSITFEASNQEITADELASRESKATGVEGQYTISTFSSSSIQGSITNSDAALYTAEFSATR